MRIAIFKSEEAAKLFSERIHTFLTKHRPRYSATKWSDVNKHATRDLWAVKLPTDLAQWKDKINVSKIEDKYETRIKNLPDDWTPADSAIG